MCSLQFLAILFTITFFHSEAFSQDPYEYRERGNRFEGRKAIGIGAPDLELLSFIGYRENVDPDGPAP